MNNLNYKKANLLIDSMYRMSLGANKAMMLALALAKKEKTRMVAQIKVADLIQALNYDDDVPRKRFYKRMQSIAMELTNQKIIIEDNDRMFKIMNLIGVASYKNGIIEVKFEPDVTEYIHNLKNNYTIFDISILSNLSTAYSFRLYELLKSRAYSSKTSLCDCNTFYANFPLANIRLLLGCVNLSENERKKIFRNGSILTDEVNVKKDTTTDFMRHIIRPAVKEINEKTDLIVDFKMERNGVGGKCESILFTFSKKTEQNPVTNL